MLKANIFYFLAYFVCCTLNNFALAGSRNESNLEGVYDKCIGDRSINNMIVYECSEKASDAAKEIINKTYKKLHSRLSAESPSDALKLDQAQKSWIIYRDLHCDLASNLVGSPMSGYCPMQMNIDRANELQELNGDH